MSEYTGLVEAIVLSLGQEPDEWHQRTGLVKRGDGLYDLFPAFPEGGTPTRVEFVLRPYAQNNARRGVTPEAILYTAMHHLDQVGASEDTRLAIKHIEQALALLHGQIPTEKDK